MNTPRLKKIIPSVALIALLCVMIALAFIPAFGKLAMPATAHSSGLDPDAVTALNNSVAYASSHDFSAEMTGKIKARVFGIPYTQKISGERGARNGECFETVETSSALASAGLKKRVCGDKCYVADGKKNGGSFDYPTEREMDRAEFVATFGKPSSGLTRYELGSSVTSAVRVDATTFRYTLDPRRAAEFYKVAVKTALGTKKYPEYSEIYFDLTVDGEMPVAVTAVEHMSIDKFGGTDCVIEYTETFRFE